jgi:hypothetical protein
MSGAGRVGRGLPARRRLRLADIRGADAKRELDR